MKMTKIILAGLIMFGTIAFGQTSIHNIVNDLWETNPYHLATRSDTTRRAIWKYGHNHVLSAANETVFCQGGLAQYINYGTLIDVVAVSANDDTSGTGIQCVTIAGLDSSWNYSEETIRLAGGDTVATTGKFVRIFSLVADTAGTGGVAAGDIKFQNTTNDTTLISIQTGATRAYAAMFTVPNGKTFYLKQIYGSTAKAIFTTFSLWVRPQGKAWYSLPGFQSWLSGMSLPFSIPYVITEKTDIELRAVGNVSDGSGGFIGWYE